MSNFLSPSYIPQFSQYIPEVDPQAYAQTARVYQGAIMQKQAQYDAGLQKVQGYYDTVGGFQMIKDVDKEHYNQRLSQLRSSVQELTKGADFSQSSVINQAMGLAAPIFNDKIIQNAVISTNNVKAYQESKAVYQKDEKTSLSNDNHTDKILNQYLNDPTPGASFGNVKYTPYYNYSKPWQDYMSGKHGNTVYWETPTTGKSSFGVAYTINQGKKTYIDPASVQRDFQTFLQMDSLANQQVQIDAEYYADRTPDNVALQGLRNNVNSTLSSLDTSLSLLEQQKASLTSTEDLAEINQKIRETQAQRDKYQLRLESGDLEREFLQDSYNTKMNLFMQNLTNGIANRYSYSEVENKIVKNPELDARIDETRLGIAQTELQLALNRDRREENKATREAAEANGMSSSNFVVGGININEPTPPEQIIQGITDMGSKVRQNQLEALYNTGNMDSLVSFGIDGKYRLVPGKTQSDFEQAWKDVSSSYYKNPAYAKPSIRRFMEATDNPEYGLGLQNIYNARKASLNKIETELDTRFSNDPNYRNYLQQVSSLGDLNIPLLTENGISVNRADLLKFIQNSKSSYTGLNLKDIAKKSGLSEDQVNLISRRGVGQLSGFGEIGKAILSGGFYDPSDPRSGGIGEEYNKIRNIVNSLDGRYTQARQEAFRPLIPLNKPTISYSSNMEGPEKKRNADLISAYQTILSDGNREAELEQFNKVLNARNKGENAPTITTGAERDPITGKVRGFLINSATDERAYIDLGPENAQIRFPQLVQADRDAIINEDLQAQAFSPNQETTTIATYFPTQGISNLKNYSLRYKVRGNPTSQRYTPIIEFWRQGTNEWQELGYGGIYYSSPSQVKSFIDQIASQGDAYFEKTFLSR